MCPGQGTGSVCDVSCTSPVGGYGCVAGIRHWLDAFGVSCIAGTG